MPAAVLGMKDMSWKKMTQFLFSRSSPTDEVTASATSNSAASLSEQEDSGPGSELDTYLLTPTPEHLTVLGLKTGQ